MDSKKPGAMNSQMQLQAAKSPEMKKDTNKSFSPASSGSQPSGQVLKECAMGLFAAKKVELNLKDLAKAQPQINLRAELFQELLESAQPQRLGVIARCALSDHDVHLLDEQNNIMSHFKPSDPVPPGFEKARQMVLNMPAKYIALVVFTNKIEAMSLNGSTEEYP